jgi:hypothetical protein
MRFTEPGRISLDPTVGKTPARFNERLMREYRADFFQPRITQTHYHTNCQISPLEIGPMSERQPSARMSRNFPAFNARRNTGGTGVGIQMNPCVCSPRRRSLPTRDGPAVFPFRPFSLRSVEARRRK